MEREIGNIVFCEIDKGSFIRGSSSAPEEYPQKSIYLSEYLISKYPITNEQYSMFVEATGYRVPPTFSNDRFNAARQPVVGVSWYDAASFCKWFSTKFGVIAALPTEAQWEKAARGLDGKTYPWGDAAPTSRRVNVNSYVGKTTEVGMYDNCSDFGCYDMLGNIWEWCDDFYDERYYKSCPDRNPHNEVSARYRVIRGGSWRSDLFRATCAHRCFYNPNVRSDRHGFRIAVDGCTGDASAR